MAQLGEGGRLLKGATPEEGVCLAVIRKSDHDALMDGSAQSRPGYAGFTSIAGTAYKPVQFFLHNGELAAATKSGTVWVFGASEIGFDEFLDRVKAIAYKN